MDILGGVVKDHAAAVQKLATQWQPTPAAQLQQQLLAVLAQVSGDDEVIVLRLLAQVLHMLPDGGKSRRGHGGAHIVGILDAQVCDGAYGAGGDFRSLPLGAEQSRPGSGDGPLGCGGPLAAVAQREPVLPLTGGKMGGGHGRHPVKGSGADEQGPKKQTLRHGGAGSVEPQVGSACIAHGESGANALVEQVPGEHQVQLRPFQLPLFQQQPQSRFLHGFLCQLPAALTEIGVLAGFVEGVAQGTFRFLFSRHAGPGGDHRRFRQNKTVPPPLVLCHVSTRFPVLGYYYRDGEHLYKGVGRGLRGEVGEVS